MDPLDLAPALRALVASAVSEAVRPAVAAALEDALPGVIRRARTSEYLSRQEAADYICRSIRSVDYLRASGAVAFVKRGGRVLFAVADLDAYLAAGAVPARWAGTAVAGSR